MIELSENALEVLQKRYLAADETPTDLCNRVSTKISSIELTEELRRYWKEKFKYVMNKLLFLPNSPTLRNAGRNNGCFSACFVIGPIEDSLKSIMHNLWLSAEVQKYGGGTGYNFSQLRPEGAIVNTTLGKSCGPVGFMKIWDVTIGEVIAQGGVRYGAQIGLLDCSHPSVKEFIKSKNIEGGLSNFNISVNITDKFMEALKNNHKWQLVFNNTIYESMVAKELWDILIYSSWLNGEPGIVFLDVINKYNPVFGYEIITGVNPCSEQPLSNMSSCNLGSINLSKFVIPFVKTVDYKLQSPEYFINWKSLREVVQIAVRFLDNVIDANNYPISEIEIETKKFRKIGLGVMGWADMLIKLKISYNSPEALELAEKVMKFINDEAVKYSEELLQEKGHGTWEGFNDPVIYAHDRTNPLFKRRNATLTTIAPTGTLSLIAGCSSGIEPIFSFEFKKKCLDGEMVIRNPLLQEWEDLEIKNIKNHSIACRPYYFIEANDVPIEQHVRMQAAFQKYVHNGVSKTVNAPNSATIEDVDQAYRLAYELGCKGITFYRDGSREYQAQTAIISEPEIRTTGKNLYEDHIIRKLPYTIKTGKDKTAIVNQTPVRGKTQKAGYLDEHMSFEQYKIVVPTIKTEDMLETPIWLPGWREKIKTGVGTLWVHVFEDPETGFSEVWTAVSKPGRDMAAAADSTGRLISLARRHGAPWEAIVKQLQGHIGETTVWDNGVQIMSIQDGTAKVLRNRCVNRNIPEFSCPFLEKCQHSSETEQGFCKPLVGGLTPSAGSNIIQSQTTDLCPDCAASLIHDEGCKGGRCTVCGYSSCS